MEKMQAEGHEPGEPKPPPKHEPRREGREREERGGRGRGRERERDPYRERPNLPSDTMPSIPLGKRGPSDRELFEGTASAPTPATGTPALVREAQEAEATAPGRRPRRERGPKPEAPPVPEGQARLWVNLGKMDGV